ncbi:phage tail protein [Streptomyces sp. NPDC005017]|uniref:phage tail protein n=1 Tax=Streptomyces sp. NPDC005017 TaxID=3364706 RepID=UPI00367CAA76
MDSIGHPYTTAFFRLRIDGLTMADFSECTGLAAETGVEEYAEGGENRFTHRFPSRGSAPSLVLKRGATADRGLWDWYSEYGRLGRVGPRDGQVQLLGMVDGKPAPVRVWSFRRGWPVKIAGPDLDAMSVGVAVESVEIAHQGLTLVTLPG